MKKKFVFILLLLFIFPFMMLNVHAEEVFTYKVLIEDDADLLTDEEEEKLSKSMKRLTEFGNIAFKSIDSNDTSTANFASSYYHSNFGTSSGTLFVIDMANRQIYIFSDGKNYSVITNSKAEIITDNIYTYATNKNYYECASSAYSQMYTLLNGGKIAEPMRHISNGILALVLAFFINFMTVLFNQHLKKASDDEIIENCDVNFSLSNLSATKTGSHRVYSPVESSSGGSSSSGGGSSGGGSSGGGGGHSF